tara:strand:- start:241 stop:570 length:330 start_codon:yes stop_codon:yes gene_type:complete
MEIFRGFAEEYGVQSPEEAVLNSRARTSLDKPHVMRNRELIEGVGWLWRAFGVGITPGTKEQEERSELGLIILNLFNRFGIADVDYEGKGREIRHWYRERETLSGLSNL